MQSVVDLLVAKGAIDEAQARKAKNDARAAGRDVSDVLIERGVPASDVLESKSQLLGVPSKTISGLKIPFEILKHIPEESASHYKMVPFAVEENVLYVGMVEPDNLEAREALQFISSSTGLPFKIFLISKNDFNGAMKGYKGLRGEVSRALGEFQNVADANVVKLPDEGISAEEMATLTEDAPITKIVAVVLRHAVEGKASDIHIEPSSDKLRVRFRVDGILYTSILLPMKTHDAIISRVKIMTNMKIDEKRKPQDGRFRARIEGRDIDFRVSTFPTYYGEKVALRILDPEVGVKSLQDLGMEGRNLTAVQEGIKRPFGMILITGPTGSGKSTSLYAMLKILNDEKRNIVSLEDPIEYYLDGINQSQMRPEIGYTFASGLRSVLRQDPDVIMVGEIRDKETAQLAVHAALTGHLVLATLHTNDTIGVIPRLIDMGIDPFLIPSTLVMAIAQRLVRTLCGESRQALAVADSVKASLDKEIAEFPPAVKDSIQVPDTIYEAKPSGTCPKGTRGRVAIFEVLSMTRELEAIVLKEPSEAKISDEAKRQNMITMRQDGILKVLAGKIGLEELLEVVV